MKIAGYEKFWNALVAGNIIQVPIVATLALLYYATGNEAYLPAIEVVIGCVGIFWGALGAAIGAYLATNTPLDVNGDPLSPPAVPMVMVPESSLEPDPVQRP